MFILCGKLVPVSGHRMDNLEGFHKHKIGRKKHKTGSSVVYMGKAEKIKRKYFKPEVKKYDHTPHEVIPGIKMNIFLFSFELKKKILDKMKESPVQDTP